MTSFTSRLGNHPDVDVPEIHGVGTDDPLTGFGGVGQVLTPALVEDLGGPGTVIRQFQSAQSECDIPEHSAVVTDDEEVILLVLEREGRDVGNGIGQKVAGDSWMVVAHHEGRILVTLFKGSGQRPQLGV